MGLCMAKYRREDVRQVANMMRQLPLTTDFLIGAGMSISAGIPIARELIRQIAERYRDEILKLPESKRSDYGACMGALTVEERKDLLKPYLDNAKVNWAHIALAALVKGNYVRRILTFNFDHVLARACGLLGVYPATYDFGIAPASHVDFLSSPAIIHLHGQGFGPVMMNSDIETEEHAEKVEPLIADCLNHSNLIVIGYSGEADKVFPKIVECYRKRRRIFWIGHSEEPGEHLAKLLIGDNGRYCTYLGGADADQFMIELAGELNVFPPAVFADPAAHLIEEMADVIEFPLSETLGRTVNLLRDTRERLAQNGNMLKFSQQQASVLVGESVETTVDPKVESSQSEEGITLLAWQYFNSGNKLKSSENYGDDVAVLENIAQAYSKAVEIKPDFHEALNNWGNALLSLARIKQDEGLFNEAFEKYRRAIEIKPGYQVPLNNWGNALSSLAQLKQDEGLFNEAFEKYRRAIEIKPDYHEALNNWGNALLKLTQFKQDEGLFNEAFEKYRRAIEIKPDYHGALNNWGGALWSLARIKQDEGLFNEAVEKCRRAIEIKPDFLEALNNWGNALSSLAQMKQDEGLFNEAIEKYRRAIEIKPDYHEALNNWGNALLSLARIKQDDGLFNEAFERYRRTIEIKPDYHEALNNWGNALLSLARIKQDEGLFNEAVEKYRRAIDIKPDFHEAFNNWGNALSSLAQIKQDEGLFNEAVEKYRRAIDIKPDFHEAFNSWGNALSSLAQIKQDDGLFNEAAQKFGAAEAIAPQETYNGACLAALRGDEALCRAKLENALRHKTLPPRKHIEDDTDLASVRGCSWFQDLLEKLPR
jgi:tetratricopeptide (TPR) repeat protein